jgi:hypothetical protein
MHKFKDLVGKNTKDNKHPEIDFDPVVGLEVINDRYARVALARMVMKLFDHWKLDDQNQLALLGLSEGSRKTLMRYRKGSPLANKRDLLDRVTNLFAIHRSLHILFPRNRNIVYRWPTIGNKAFKGKSPVQLIRDEGFAGLLVVRHYLDVERVKG